MKIKSIKILNDGMNEVGAEALWNTVEGYAAYCFNKSHSAAYSLVSYLTMWLKVRYPAEFFAAAMTVVDDGDKLSSLVLDARRVGLEVLPPDINRSSNRIEVVGERTLYAPFQAVKGISGNVAGHILSAREKLRTGIRSEDGAVVLAPDDLFRSRDHFEAVLSKAGLMGKCNVRHREALDRVGAFASTDAELRPAMHPDRLKDRIELMPGFTVDAVKPDRVLCDERLAKLQIMELIGETRTCEGCSLKGCDHPIPRLGKAAKFMIVFDSPTWKEGKAGKLLTGDIGDYMKAAFSEVGLDFNDGYFTTLVKSPKAKDAKALTTEQINGCSKYLAREIDILKPPVIVAMGSNSIRYFAPGVKGSPGELAGKVVFRNDLDASVIFGLNPSSIYFDGSKVKLLQDVCMKLVDLIS